MDITKKIAEGILSCFKEANGVVTFDKVKPMIDEQIHEILKDLQEYYNNNDNEEYAADSKCAEESFYGGIQNNQLCWRFEKYIISFSRFEGC